MSTLILTWYEVLAFRTQSKHMHVEVESIGDQFIHLFKFIYFEALQDAARDRVACLVGGHLRIIARAGEWVAVSAATFVFSISDGFGNRSQTCGKATWQLGSQSTWLPRGT